MCLSTCFQTVWGEFRMYFKNFSPNPTEPEDRCYWISGNFTILNDFLIWKFSLGGVFILGSGSPHRNSTLFRHVLAHLQSFIEIPKLGFAPHVFKDHSISRKIRIETIFQAYINAHLYELPVGATGLPDRLLAFFGVFQHEWKNISWRTSDS